ncbi:FtsK/SpoIIIE domain-containing protein [Sphaerisporangium viridialbum]|uniref:FtsK/SpoIIIE domain-containing protein n=1 Tax=Sphaerisporangium viridialbum TaxID=46189 RepID=UPI003C7097BA
MVGTPAIVVIVVWVWRLLVGLVKTVVRHPFACGVVAALGGVCWVFGWQAGAAVGVVACCGLSAWAAIDPAGFMAWVGWRAVSWGRWMWVYRRRWRSVVTVAGLAANVGGRGYAPELVKVSCDRASDRLRVKLLDGQTDAEWADRSPNLAHAFGAGSCRVAVERPGWLVLTFPRRDELAAVVRARPMPAVPSVGPVDIGVCEDGSPYRLKVHGTHVLIAGATGAGKGSWLWSAVRGLVPASRAGLVELWALDPKHMELSYGLALFDQYAAAAEDCAGLLEHAVKVMQDRAARYAGVRRSHVPTVDDPFVLVIVDEVAFLTAYQPDKGLRLRISAALATLTTQGRAVGVGVMAALQDPRKEVMSIRNLFPDRVALRLDEPSQVDMVLGDGARDRGALADLIPRDPDDPSVGAGVAYVRLENAPEPIRVRAGYVSDADIRQMVILKTQGV